MADWFMGVWTRGQTRRELDKIRAAQAYFGAAAANTPNYCLAAAKFTAGKLVGIFGRDKSFDDFRKSAEAKRAARKLGDAQMGGTGAFNMTWGGNLGQNASFNKTILPEAIAWAGSAATGVAFTFDTNAAVATERLAQGVVLVVGVNLLKFDGERDHFMTMFQGREKCVWLIDSINKTANESVTQPPVPVNFAAGFEINTLLGPTRVPCNPGFFGWYEQGGKPMTLGLDL